MRPQKVVGIPPIELKHRFIEIDGIEPASASGDIPVRQRHPTCGFPFFRSHTCVGLGCFRSITARGGPPSVRHERMLATSPLGALRFSARPDFSAQRLQASMITSFFTRRMPSRSIPCRKAIAYKAFCGETTNATTVGRIIQNRQVSTTGRANPRNRSYEVFILKAVSRFEKPRFAPLGDSRRWRCLRCAKC
jgi:hypothetical protein